MKRLLLVAALACLAMACLAMFAMAEATEYSVEFNYGDIEYVMPGGGAVPLSEILDALNLRGEVSAVSVSDESLFSVSNESGEWIVSSHKPFDTTERMTVTIGGIVSEITVTDGLGAGALYYIKPDGEEDYFSYWNTLETSQYSGNPVYWDGSIIDRYANKERCSVWIGDQVVVQGDVKLVLLDDMILHLDKGIHILEGSTLTIYGQKLGSGILEITCADNGLPAIWNSGTLMIYGGKIEATSGSGYPGIGSSEKEDVGKTYIFGGSVKAIGGSYAAGIGGGQACTGGFVSISGGYVYAIGGMYAAGIGGGYGGDGGQIGISSGRVCAMGFDGGAGIGGGWFGNCGRLSISGGSIEAMGNLKYGSRDYGGAGIGGGYCGVGGFINISGGTITALGGYQSAGIGGSYKGNAVDIRIEDGDITAIPGGDAPTCIGGGAEAGSHGSLVLGDCLRVGKRSGSEVDSTVNWVSYERRQNTCRETIDAGIQIKPCAEHVWRMNGHCAYCRQGGGPVAYLDITATDPNDYFKRCASYTIITDQTVMENGWYAVISDVQIDTRIQVNGNVNIILCENTMLTATQGFHVTGSNSLTFWGQGSRLDDTGGVTVAEPESCCAGIGGNDLEAGGNVTVNGGVLNITGGYKSAAIGGGRSGAGGNITINSGYVTVNGANMGSGLGGGTAINKDYTGGSVGNVTISGGVVIATGGSNGAGIGGGAGSNENNGSSGGKVTITGGMVTASGGNNAAGIGGGSAGGGCNVRISGGTVIAIAGSSAEAIGRGAGNVAGSGDLNIDGMRVYTSNTTAESVTLADRFPVCRGTWAKLQPCEKHSYSYQGICMYCGDECNVFGNQTALETGYYVVVADTQINDRVEINGDVNLMLCEGTTVNVVKGFHVTGENSLTIWSQSDDRATAGRLTVTEPGSCEAGIGGNNHEDCGTVIINGGVIESTGGWQGAGIGGGAIGTGGNITINGGYVTAKSTQGGAAIGGGGGENDAGSSGGDAGDITINGGEVTAIGGQGAAGIGVGCGIDIDHGNNGLGFLFVYGGKVTANGGFGGAGIGGGKYSCGCHVIIRGGKVNATGGTGGAGIGGGYGGAGGEVSIYSGKITATGGEWTGGYASGIGGGFYGEELEYDAKDTGKLRLSIAAEDDFLMASTYGGEVDCDSHIKYLDDGGKHFLGTWVYNWLNDSARIALKEEIAGKKLVPANPHTVNVEASENGTVTASPTLAEAGDPVVLTLDCDAGWTLSALTVTGPNGDLTVSDNRFTMPAGNVNVSVVWRMFTRLTLPQAVTLIGEEAFEGIAAERVEIGENVRSIDARAFANCKALREIVIPEGVASIDDNALAGCENVKVYGKAGTEAERFARAAGFAFVACDAMP